MSKHTPGPWAIETDHDEPIEDTVLIHGAADCPGLTPVALVYTADAFPCVEDEDRTAFEAECKANAALIAAAPDLLKACMACDRAFASWQIGQIPGRPNDILRLIAQVRAVIAKAHTPATAIEQE